MIVDAHCHAWTYWPYEPPVPDPEHRGRVEQLLWEMDQNGVDRALIVSAGIDHNPENNAYVAESVAAHPDRLGQLADVDSSWTPTHHQPGAADRLREIAARWPIKGLTHYVQPTNDGWFRSAEGVAFFETAAELDLIVSLSASPAWQEDIRTIARRFPTMPILCHHLAGLRAGERPPFEELLEVLRSAALPNILVKVSGYYYGSHRPWDFPFSDTLRVVRTLFEHFGPHRLCWGSDYPVVRRAMTYTQALEIVRTHCSWLSEEDRGWILGGTLERVIDTRRPVGAG